jgi:pimeloyl-ACP methyl ester carboxylesterase
MSSFARRHLKGRGIIAGLGVFLALAVALTASAFAASANTQSSKTGASGKPTIVLVHGGWDNSSGWNGVVARLNKRGFDVIAPANPLRDLASDSAYISSVLDSIEGPIVLVGHSYGGAVITNAALGQENVEALVYIAAFAPDEDESLVQLVTMNPGSEIGPTTLLTRPYPPADGGEGTDLYLTREGIGTAFAADVPQHIADLMFATQRPFSQEAFENPSGPPAWESIPSWYLVATQDRAIPPATQRFMAERAGAPIREVASSHVPQISRPGAVTRIILQAAESLN